MTLPNRSGKPDLVELYGLDAADPAVAGRILSRDCPFTNDRCSMILRGSPNPTGVCSVTAGTSRSPVILCRDRFYGDHHATLRLINHEVFGSGRFIIGGEISDLRREVSAGGPAVVAFGETSGGRVQVSGKGKVSFDWVLQRYDGPKNRLGFVAVDIEVAKMTGSYRDALDGYRLHHSGKKTVVPASAHVIDWADLNKVMLPALIRKGLILANTSGCQGFFVLMSENAYSKIEDLLDETDNVYGFGRDVISFRIYAPDRSTPSGVRFVRAVNKATRDIAAAYYAQSDEAAAEKLDAVVAKLL